MKLMRLTLPIAVAIACNGAHAQKADESDSSADHAPLAEVTIVGDPDALSELTGAATLISAEEILRFNQTDIQRIIRSAPGVTVQVEDGYGLRPNLSIRGTASERSARVTLLEDGILIAPAPYAAPAAYYFPTAGRLAGVEVLKGPATITEGPYTVGGAINLLSTPIPEERAGFVNTQIGEDATWRVHAHYGQNDGKFGWLVETHQWGSDGFQTLDNGGDTGLSKQDYMVKLRYEFDERGGWAQSLDLKLQHATEDSDQSYLGLTDEDFVADPVRRYGISGLDNIDTTHDQILIRHRLSRGDFELTTSLYHNEFERDWFKTEGYDVTGSADAQSFNGVSWFQFIQAANRGVAIGNEMAVDLRAILNGRDTPDGAIQIRSNAREYYSTGVEFDAKWILGWGDATHNLAMGLRFHTDHSERLQRNSTYTQTNGELVLDDLGLLGNGGNQEQDADVIALYVRDEIEVGNWVIAPGVRFESIAQDRTRWETRPGFTTDPSSRADSNIRDQRENDIEVVIPGIGLAYAVNDQWSLYGGAHKGFSAPSNAPGVDEEESINYELGARFFGESTSLDVGLFLTDYDNLVGTCTSSSGVDCEVGDAFNGDAATVVGIELAAEHVFAAGERIEFPVQLTMTLIDAEFDSDIADTDFFGAVSAGDPLPYVPEYQGLLSVGATSEKWSAFLSLNLLGDACARASCDAFEELEASTIVDTAFQYRWSEKLTLTATVENLTDDLEIVGRTPYGARPNTARTATVGAIYSF
ncbi:MAG: TonB-dependent receptor [Pseudomonadota bacterium]